MSNYRHRRNCKCSSCKKIKNREKKDFRFVKTLFFMYVCFISCCRII